MLVQEYVSKHFKIFGFTTYCKNFFMNIRIGILLKLSFFYVPLLHFVMSSMEMDLHSKRSSVRACQNTLFSSATCLSASSHFLAQCQILASICPPCFSFSSSLDMTCILTISTKVFCDFEKFMRVRMFFFLKQFPIIRIFFRRSAFVPMCYKRIFYYGKLLSMYFITFFFIIIILNIFFEYNFFSLRILFIHFLPQRIVLRRLSPTELCISSYVLGN